MDATGQSDAIERAMMARVAEIYAGALRKALRDKRAFLRKVDNVVSGKTPPPAYYVQTGQVDRWRAGYIAALQRQNKVIDGIMDRLNRAGVEAEKLIRKGMVDIYRANREESAETMTQEAAEQGVQTSFTVFNARQIDVLIQQEQSPFSRVAYKRLGDNPAARRRLQNELAMASILGEGQEQIIRRIRKVTGQTVAQARRVAQTERTRVQSQARWQAGNDAEHTGLKVYNIWRTRMVRSRESHIALTGKPAMQGGRFPGSVLRYPGDPDGRAADVINCHCVLEPHILRKGYRVTDDGRVERTS